MGSSHSPGPALVAAAADADPVTLRIPPGPRGEPAAAASRSGVPPLRPGTHCTGTPLASAASGAVVTTTGTAPSSSLRQATVTGWPASASIVGPGTVPS